MTEGLAGLALDVKARVLTRTCGDSDEVPAWCPTVRSKPARAKARKGSDGIALKAVGR